MALPPFSRLFPYVHEKDPTAQQTACTYILVTVACAVLLIRLVWPLSEQGLFDVQ